MIEKQLLRIHSPEAGAIHLGLLEKRAASLDSRFPPVLLVHGATLGHRLFDLPRPGYSLMDELAKAGRVVYAVDIRGYGTSVGGAVMEESAAMNPPYAGVGVAVEDIAAAVDFIRKRRGVAALDLIGFSWGTITAARYAGTHPDKIARLALYAPLYGENNVAWLERIADPCDRRRLAPTYGAYRLITLSDLVRRWDDELPTRNSSLFREDGVPELVFEALASLDPLSASRTPPAFRCPNGALADMVATFNGRPLYEAAKLKMPTLLLRGAEDVTSTDSDARRLSAEIASPLKDYRAISLGSHFLCIERNRAKLIEQFLEFFEPI
ncbi:MAG TPA: alpha/beta fold hydrolase [Pseudolabrys sp.]|jgi:pimeloyl-ACP methyl ester carboxylesterase|nr:alpha/beta fold hydrolase [Pseudolabrys sp.]